MIGINRLKGIKIKDKSILIYTLFFLIIEVLVYKQFIDQGKSLVWSADAFRAYIPTMYEIREDISTILASGFQDIPFWNWNIGLGLNITPLYLLDMFNFLNIFIPKELLVNAYSFFIIVKTYLAGLFFIFYLKEIKINKVPSIIGGLVYAFCGFTLYAGIRHSFFMNPMIIFPLIILGIEKYINKKQSKLLMVAVVGGAINNYYFLYMMSIGAAIYTIIKYWSMENKNIKECIRGIFDIGIKALLSMGLLAFMLVPGIYLFLSSNRLIEKINIPLIYSESYYKAFIASFISPKLTGSWTVLMFSSIVIVIIPVLFTKLFKGFEYIRTTFIVMTIMLLIPYVGSAMNGFSNISNRWCFMYVFFVACIVAIGLAKIHLLENKHYIIISITLVMHLIFILITQGLKVQFIIPELFGILFLIIIILKKYYSNTKYNKITQLCMLIVLTLNIAYVANYFYSPNGGKYINEFLSNKGILDKYYENSKIISNNIDDKTLFRTDAIYNGSVMPNSGQISNINSSGQFTSTIDADLYNFWKENDEFNIKNLNATIGYDNRTALETLLSVKYKILKDNDEAYLGKGYEFIKDEGKNKLYENKYALPIGVFYSNSIEKEEYMNLPKIDRAMGLLQGVVLDDSTSKEKINDVVPKIYSSDIKYKVVKKENVKISSNKIIVSKENSELILQVNIPADSEIYLSMKELDKKETSGKSIYVSRNSNERKIELFADNNKYNPNISDKLINLGYTEKTLNNEYIKLRFADKGTYTFNELGIKVINMLDYEHYVEQLAKNKLTDIKYGRNFVSGNIETDVHGIMFFSIPFDKGWTAKVDNQNVETIKVNSGFIGVPIESGNHSVVLNFYPPGLNIGIVITCICGLIIGIGYFKKKYKK